MSRHAPCGERQDTRPPLDLRYGPARRRRAPGHRASGRTVSRDGTRARGGRFSLSRIFAILALFVVAACASHSFVTKRDEAAGFNGSFEIADSGYPVNWSFSESPLQSGDMIVSLDTQIVRDGQQSLRVEVLNAQEAKEFFYQVWTKPAFSARTAIQPGKGYRISLWLRDLGAKVHVRWVTTSSDYQKHYRHRDMLESEELSEEWHCAEDYLTVEKGEALLDLVFVATAPGVFWCDDVKVEEVNPAG